MTARRRIIVLTAPSGSGKTTIARRVMEGFPEIVFSVSATTRAPRDGETDGTDYHFVSEAEFRRLIDDGLLLEYEEVYPGRFYGTLRSEVDRVATESPVLLDIDVKGAENVKSIYRDEVLTIFIRPPSLAVLEERLRQRGTESEEAIRERLRRASLEMERSPYFDRTVVNDELERAVAETMSHIDRFLKP